MNESSLAQLPASAPAIPSVLRRYAVVCAHRMGLWRRTTLYATDAATAERMAWCWLSARGVALKHWTVTLREEEDHT